MYKLVPKHSKAAETKGTWLFWIWVRLCVREGVDINLQLLWISADQLHLLPPLKHKHEGWSLSWKSLCLFHFIIYKWDPHNPHFLSTVYHWLCWGTKKILDCHNKCICSVISKYFFLGLKRSEVAVSKERAKTQQLMSLTSDPLQERLTSCIRCDLLTVRLGSFNGHPWNTHKTSDAHTSAREQQWQYHSLSVKSLSRKHTESIDRGKVLM